MVRTQVRLTQKEYDTAKAEAARLGISMAELVRRSLRAFIPAESQPWMRFAGFVSSGDPDASRKVDDVVYSTKY